MNLLNQFISHLSARQNLSAVTVKNYKADVNHFLSWFAKELTTPFNPTLLTNEVLDLYKTSSGVSPRSLERHISSLRTFSEFLRQNAYPAPDLRKEIAQKSKSDDWHLNAFQNHLYNNKASHHTIKNYIIDIQQFLSWAQKVNTNGDIFKNFHPSWITQYRERLLQLGMSPLSINRKLSSLRKYTTWLHEKQIIQGRVENISNYKKEYQKLVSLPQEDTAESPYSRFPPFRLFQKTGNGIVLLFDTSVIAPLAFLLKFKNRLFTPTTNQLFAGELITIASPQSRFFVTTPNVSKSFYAPLGVRRSEWNKIGLTILFLSVSGLGGIYGYNHIGVLKNTGVLSSIANAQTKTISFEGKLTDNSGTAITSPTPVGFALYDSATNFGESLLWNETIDVLPDKDGNFTITLGTQTPLSSNVFLSDAVYLGIAIGNGQELSPRQLMANVNSSANAETIQGLPLITQAVDGVSRNVVLALDSGGNLTIRNSSPTFQATDGTFTLAGKVLVLTTTAGSNGNIELNPDGSGIVDIQKPIQNTTNYNNSTGVPGAVVVEDLLSVLATSSAQSAFTVNQNGGGSIISASSSGTAKFTLESDGSAYIAGNVGIGTQSATTKLQVAGTISPSAHKEYDLGSPTLYWDTLYVNNIISSATGSAAFWQRNNGAITPSTITDPLNLGATATSSATVHLAAIENQNSFIKSGNVGLGTADPIARLHVQGNQYISGNVGIGTSSPNYNLDVNGSINASGDIYKNGTAFNNPDYVFEKWVTSDIVKFANNAGASSYAGILSLDETEAYVLQNLQLPRVVQASGIFERGDILLEKVEEAYIHLFDLNRKISSLLETLTTNKIISPIASIDTLYTNIISPLSSEGDIIVRLATNSAIAKSEFIIQNSSGSAVTTINSIGDITTAGEITAKDASISGTLRARRIVADQIDGLDVMTATLAAQYVTNITNVYEATESATPASLNIDAYAPALLHMGNFESTFGQFNEGLISLGPTSMTDVSVSGLLSVGGNLMIDNTTINVLGADLSLQPLRQGGISFLAGRIYIDKEGNLSSLGNASFEKDVRVGGALSAHTVTSLGDLIASGAATIKKLNFDLVKEVIAVSDTEIIATGSAGVATISAQQSSITIQNNLITENSLVYITPRDQTSEIIFLLQQIPGESFTIGIDQPTAKNIPFNWLLIN